VLPETLIVPLRKFSDSLRWNFVEGAAAAAWFDGFWDFFVNARTAIERGPSAAAHGALEGLGICVLAWVAEGAKNPRLDIFVESKDRRPGARAPWPVTTVALSGGDLAEAARMEPRQIPPGAAMQLQKLGATARISYWGPHVTFEGASTLDDNLLHQLVKLSAGLAQSSESA
jgi:hypothetical protein